MSSPNSLKEIYIEEMRDLWSANNQMAEAVKGLKDHVTDPKLKRLLERSVEAIDVHTDTLKSLIEAGDGQAEPAHCRSMEGIVSEALKHGVEDAPKKSKLRDIAIIAQYQRMSHYGIAGFGSAVAYARALGFSDEETKLKAALSKIYKGDEYAGKLAERLEELPKHFWYA